MDERAAGLAGIDTSVAHPARRYNYLLGGKDNFAADREAGDAAIAAWPALPELVRENRKFLGRAVRFLAAERGVRRFLDVGTGIPTADNTHEVAQALAPESRVVYVDNDPLVLVHARALLTSTPQGRTSYVQADLREPETILRSPEAAALLADGEPVALLLVAVLHFVSDDEGAFEHVATLLDALPAGSYLAVSHITADDLSAETFGNVRTSDTSTTQGVFRARDNIARFFTGAELVDPGLVPVARWRSDPGAQVPTDIGGYAGIAQKP